MQFHKTVNVLVAFWRQARFCLTFDSYHIYDLPTERFSVVVHKAETAAVIRGGKVVPDRSRNFVLVAECNHITEPVLTVFVFEVTDRTGHSMTTVLQIIPVIFLDFRKLFRSSCFFSKNAIQLR